MSWYSPGPGYASIFGIPRSHMTDLLPENWSVRNEKNMVDSHFGKDSVHEEEAFHGAADCLRSAAGRARKASAMTNRRRANKKREGHRTEPPDR